MKKKILTNCMKKETLIATLETGAFPFWLVNQLFASPACVLSNTCSNIINKTIVLIFAALEMQ